MLIGVIVVPGVVGVLTLALTAKDERDGRRALEAVARGYPLTILLAVLLVFLALLAIWRKGNSLARRWTDAHVPMVVKPGAYDQVADDLDKALTDAGFDLDARDGAGDDVDAGEVAGRGRRSDVVVARPRPDAPAARHGPRHPDLPDGHPHLGQARRRDPSPGGDGQPADDVGSPPDRDGRGTGDRGSPHGAGEGTRRGARPSAAVR